MEKSRHPHAGPVNGVARYASGFYRSNLQQRMDRLERYTRSTGVILPLLPSEQRHNHISSANASLANSRSDPSIGALTAANSGSSGMAASTEAVAGSSQGDMPPTNRERIIRGNRRTPAAPDHSYDAASYTGEADDSEVKPCVDTFRWSGHRAMPASSRQAPIDLTQDEARAARQHEAEGPFTSPSRLSRTLSQDQQFRPDLRGNLRYLGPASTSSVVAELADRQKWHAAGNTPPGANGDSRQLAPAGQSGLLDRPWDIFSNLGITVAGAIPKLEDVDLPDDSLARTLIEAFFDVVCPIFPLLHRTTFIIEYDAFRAAPLSKADPTFVCKLLTVFACGAVVLPTDERVHVSGGYSATDEPKVCNVSMAGNVEPPFPDDRDSAKEGGDHPSYCFGLADSMRRRGAKRPGSRFYAQANVVLLHALAKPCIEQVVIYGLMAFYHVANNAAARAWVLVGGAIRIAIELGLHRSSASFAPLERENRRRVFWALYCLEGLLAANLGRPASLPDDEIDAELPQDVNLDMIVISGDARPVDNRIQRSELTGFLHLLALHRLSADALRTINKHQRAATRARSAGYHGTRSPALGDLQPKLLDYEQKLQRWFAEIPPSLNEEYHALTSAERAQKHIMTALYPSTYLLLFLPLLPQKNVAISDFQIYALSRCIMASKDLIIISSPIAQTLCPSHYLFDFTQNLLVAGTLLILMYHRGLEDKAVMTRTQDEVQKALAGLEEISRVFVGGQAGFSMLLNFRDRMRRDDDVASDVRPATQESLEMGISGQAPPSIGPHQASAHETGDEAALGVPAKDPNTVTPAQGPAPALIEDASTSIQSYRTTDGSNARTPVRARRAAAVAADKRITRSSSAALRREGDPPSPSGAEAQLRVEEDDDHSDSPRKRQNTGAGYDGAAGSDTGAASASRMMHITQREYHSASREIRDVFASGSQPRSAVPGSGVTETVDNSSQASYAPFSSARAAFEPVPAFPQQRSPPSAQPAAEGVGGLSTGDKRVHSSDAPDWLLMGGRQSSTRQSLPAGFVALPSEQIAAEHAAPRMSVDGALQQRFIPTAPSSLGIQHMVTQPGGSASTRTTPGPMSAPVGMLQGPTIVRGAAGNWPSDHLHFGFAGLDELTNNVASTFDMRDHGHGAMQIATSTPTHPMHSGAGDSAHPMPFGPGGHYLGRSDNMGPGVPAQPYLSYQPSQYHQQYPHQMFRPSYGMSASQAAGAFEPTPPGQQQSTPFVPRPQQRSLMGDFVPYGSRPASALGLFQDETSSQPRPS